MRQSKKKQYKITSRKKVLLGAFVFALSFVWGTSTYHAIEAPTTPLEVISSDEFPIGVNPDAKEIVENSEVDSFYRKYVYSGGPVLSSRREWLRKALDKVALMPWYQSLASVSSRTLVIYAGERKEEIAVNFSKILHWNTDEKNEFQKIIEEDVPLIPEGKFYPGRYVVSKRSTPTDVAELVYGKFQSEILNRYTDSVEEIVPIHDALRIASILEREAHDFNDMRYISGIIWNRLFSDMLLQIDATLQYARASQSDATSWPIPRPSDKKIESLFNTYLHVGLPPYPISNPSAEAVLAALNPRITDCIYYFHDQDAGFHCSKTYKEHQALIAEYY